MYDFDFVFILEYYFKVTMTSMFAWENHFQI